MQSNLLVADVLELWLIIIKIALPLFALAPLRHDKQYLKNGCLELFYIDSVLLYVSTKKVKMYMIKPMQPYIMVEEQPPRNYHVCLIS